MRNWCRITFKPDQNGKLQIHKTGYNYANKVNAVYGGGVQDHMH